MQIGHNQSRHSILVNFYNKCSKESEIKTSLAVIISTNFHTLSTSEQNDI